MSRSPRKALSAAGVLLLLLTASSAAQEGPPPDARASLEQKMERLERAYRGEPAERIREAVERAREEGLPVEPVVDKALEGAAKGVAPPRVAAVVSGYVDRLSRGRDLLPDGASGALVTAAADALRRGVPGEAVRALARTRSEETPMALVVLGDLVEMGVPAEPAEAVVRQALEKGHTGDELLVLPAAVRRRIRSGAPPEQAASTVAEGIRRGAPLPVPSGGPETGPPVPPGAGAPGQEPAGEDPPGGGGGGSGGGI